MSEKFDSSRQRPVTRHVFESGPVEAAKSATMLPLVILFQRAWELAHSVPMPLDRLVHAAEAVALADAVAHLLAEAGDHEGCGRWAVRLSEARHWCAVVQDALAFQDEDEDEKGRHGRREPR